MFMVPSHQQNLLFVMQPIRLCFYYPFVFCFVCSGNGRLLENGSLGRRRVCEKESKIKCGLK
jgi:hypothetical protein